MQAPAPESFRPAVPVIFAAIAPLLLLATATIAQQPANSITTPLAIVPLDGKNPPTVTGSLEVSAGRALIANSGTVTAGDSTAEVTLPRRGKLLVCATTVVKLATGSGAQAGEVPGLLIALDRGALETSFATGQNSDVILTPDFRILIGSPGASAVKVRLGEHGDTCVDNPGIANENQEAPYVIVTSVFEGGAYRVQPGQRVMFEHGSTREVNDQEKEPCGCPPPPQPGTNEFPLAQSAGLAPLPKPAGGAALVGSDEAGTQIQPLVKNGGEPIAKPATDAKTAGLTDAPVPSHTTQKSAKKRGFLGSIGHFFKQIFGAE